MTNPEVASQMLELVNNNSSKSSDKLIIIMAGLISCPWDKVDSLSLEWECIDTAGEDVVVPSFKIKMKDDPRPSSLIGG